MKQNIQLDASVLNDLVERILDVSHPSKIILFGSAARGELKTESDLDVLVIMPDGNNRNETAKKIYRNLIGFSIAVDVVVATETDVRRFGDKRSLVYYPALREGRELYAA
ncbi:MAG: nucleotidyltransferase domain-containing protein [Armatimonadota bacterium]